MKLTGPACTEAMSEAEKAKRRERAEGSAGGVRVERRVRPKNDKMLLVLCNGNYGFEPMKIQMD